jgi:DNA polymerase-3 subunit delta'
MVGGMDQSHLFRYIDKIILAKRQLLSGANPNKQLLLEELLMDWRALARLSLGRPRQS